MILSIFVLQVMLFLLLYFGIVPMIESLAATTRMIGCISLVNSGLDPKAIKRLLLTFLTKEEYESLRVSRLDKASNSVGQKEQPDRSSKEL